MSDKILHIWRKIFGSVLKIALYEFILRRISWTQNLDRIPDDELNEGIEDNGGVGDRPDDIDIIVFLQPTPKQILCIFSHF